ncbi:hypothetical protein CSB69_4229 [Morganella morganii]|nr:hypothetical protein CSB69_4229 [Morganella morganii]
MTVLANAFFGTQKAENHRNKGNDRIRRRSYLRRQITKQSSLRAGEKPAGYKNGTAQETGSAVRDSNQSVYMDSISR